MRHSRSLANSAVLAGLLILIHTHEAHAYIDPGTGSYVLQVIIGGLVGALFVVKVYWRRIKAFFSSLFLTAEEKENDNE